MNALVAQFGGSGFGPPPIFMFFFVAIFVIVIGGILFGIGKSVSEWASNNAQPVQCDDARIVSKRTDVSGGQKSTSTSYYLTFDLGDAGRKELRVTGRDFGQFAEGDLGRLTHQGTRFLGFAREPQRLSEPYPIAAAEIPANLVCPYCGGAIPAGRIKCEGCGWTWKPGRPGEVDARS